MTRTESSNKYNQANTKAITIRFNFKTDADILEKLSNLDGSMLGYIKRLIRDDIAKESK